MFAKRHLPGLAMAMRVGGLTACVSDAPTMPVTGRDAVQATVVDAPVTRIVTTNADAGAGSLRQAVLDAGGSDVMASIPL